MINIMKQNLPTHAMEPSSRKLSISTILFLLLQFVVLRANTMELVDNNSNRKLGFSLELVHCDSVDSPLYPGNLTSAERMQRDVRLSESRRLWLESTTSATVVVGPQDHSNIRPILTNDASMYTVKVGIGTDPQIESHLLVDTGSGLVWIQSEPCNTCFEHDGPSYKPTLSRSSRRLPSSNPICKPPFFQRSPSGQLCTYEFKYGSDGRHTRGALRLEKFSFESKSDPRSLATVDKIIFGASNNNSRDMFPNNRKLLGILGMDMAEFSFPVQMARRDDRLGRFSYCLVPENGASSHLRFGSDVIMEGVYQRTQFLKIDSLYYYYYLNLLDVSVDGEALHLPPGTFLPDPIRRSGGVIIDSGSPKTYFIERAYDAVVGALVRYFEGRLGLRRVPTPDGRQLCYGMPADGNLDDFPEMGFHFEGGATLRPDGDQVFNVIREKRQFCLFMAPSAVMTIIGAHVQRNVHFVYDVLGKQLHFASKDCRAV